MAMGIALRRKRLDSKGGDGNRRYVPSLCGPLSHSSIQKGIFVPSKCLVRVLGDPACPGTVPQTWRTGYLVLSGLDA